MIFNHLLDLCVALLYLILSTVLWTPIIQGGRTILLSKKYHFLLFATLILHAISLYLNMIGQENLHFNLAVSLSTTFWLACFILWIEAYRYSIGLLFLLILPLCTLSSLFVFITQLDPNPFDIPLQDTLFQIHLISSLLAYSLLSICFLYSGIMLMSHRELKSIRPIQKNDRLLTRLMNAQPCLVAQEKILFHFLWISYIILTLSFFSGIAFSIRFMNIVFPINGKTIFSTLSWLILSVLLFSQWLYQWHGTKALYKVILALLLLCISLVSALTIQYILY